MEVLGQCLDEDELSVSVFCAFLMIAYQVADCVVHICPDEQVLRGAICLCHCHCYAAQNGA